MLATISSITEYNLQEAAENTHTNDVSNGHLPGKLFVEYPVGYTYPAPCEEKQGQKDLSLTELYDALIDDLLDPAIQWGYQSPNFWLEPGDELYINDDPRNMELKERVQLIALAHAAQNNSNPSNERADYKIVDGMYMIRIPGMRKRFEAYAQATGTIAVTTLSDYSYILSFEEAIIERKKMKPKERKLYDGALKQL